MPPASLLLGSLAALLLPFPALSQRVLHENETCGYGGVCTKVEYCPEAIEMLKRRQRPPVCNLLYPRPIVCCYEPSRAPGTTTGTGTSSATRVGEKSKTKCEEYSQYVFKMVQSPLPLPGAKPIREDTCGRVEEALIVGGKNAGPREFPHMALVGYGDSPNVKYLCGGSLISEKFVLSAAHCTDPGPQWGVAKWVKLGDLDTESNRDEASPVEIRIRRRIDHPEYNKNRLYNDISLYELEKNVVFNEFIRPICLDTGNPPVTDLTGIATGWGHTEWGGRGSNTLKKVRIFYKDARTCNETYKSSIGKQLPYGILPESQLCAGEDGKDTCQGDSGGPLQVSLLKPHCMYKQVGVTSFGKACGNNYPGVYTRVSHYINWIEKNVFP